MERIKDFHRCPNMQIALWTAGVVVFTLLINAPIMPKLIQWTGLSEVSQIKADIRAKAARSLLRYTKTAIHDLQHDEDEMLRGPYLSNLSREIGNFHFRMLITKKSKSSKSNLIHHSTSLETHINLYTQDYRQSLCKFLFLSAWSVSLDSISCLPLFCSDYIEKKLTHQRSLYLLNPILGTAYLQVSQLFWSEHVCQTSVLFFEIPFKPKQGMTCISLVRAPMLHSMILLESSKNTWTSHIVDSFLSRYESFSAW